MRARRSVAETFAPLRKMRWTGSRKALCSNNKQEKEPSLSKNEPEVVLCVACQLLFSKEEYEFHLMTADHKSRQKESLDPFH